MNATDIRATAIANEVYPMLAECATNSGITVSDLIRELHAKQSLIDIRAAMAAEKRIEVAN
jgi:predicted CopG family antitoxin